MALPNLPPRPPPPPPPPGPPRSTSQALGGILAQEPWIEMKDGDHYCLACNKWATPEHLGNAKHQDRVAWWKAEAGMNSAIDPLMQEPWIEMRQGNHFCIACGKWATPEHLQNSNHQWRIQSWGRSSDAPPAQAVFTSVSVESHSRVGNDDPLAREPWIEMKEGCHYCLACGKWATPEHLTNERHTWKVSAWFSTESPTYPQPSVAEQSRPPCRSPPCAPAYLVPLEDFELTHWDEWSKDWKCKLCDKWATQEHVESAEHQRHVQVRKRNARAALPANERKEWQQRPDGMLPCVLLVAEKPSIARAWAQALYTKTWWKWTPYPDIEDATPVFRLDRDAVPFEGCQVRWVITSTNGQVRDTKIAGGLPSRAPDPDFFTAYVHDITNVEQEPMEAQLIKLAGDADVLLLCLDADNEGEHIAHDVADIVEMRMRDRATACILRIDFVSLGVNPLRTALNHPRTLDMNKVDAVSARRELDLKLGHAMTLALGEFVGHLPQRVQNSLREAHSTKGEAKGKGKGRGKAKVKGNTNERNEAEMQGVGSLPLLSYGPCQTPALFFCVKHEVDQEAVRSVPPQYRVGVELQSEGSGQRFEVWSDLLDERSAETVQGQLTSVGIVAPSSNERQTKNILNRSSYCAISEESCSPSLSACAIGEEYQSSLRHQFAPLASIRASVASTRCQRMQGLERPLPMNTWTLEQVASAVLGLTPEETMASAQWLYEHGSVSYPRTDSSTYSDDFDIDAVLHGLATGKSRVLSDMEEYPTFEGPGVVGVQRFAERLLREHMMPREGFQEHEDGHEPITPLVETLRADSGYHDNRYWNQHLPVYELIVRYFLATLAQDCQVTGIEVQFQSDMELPCCGVWHARSRRVQERGWFEVFPVVYSRDVGPELGAYVPGDKMQILSVRKQKQPLPPSCLTMSKLLELMKFHGIGTDASAYQHIRTLLERGYASCAQDGRSIDFWDGARLLSEQWSEPVDLDSLWHAEGRKQLHVKAEVVGKQLVYWLWRHAQKLVLPSVRADVEADCASISRGDRRCTEVVDMKLKEFCRQFMEVKPLMLTPAQPSHQELVDGLSNQHSGHNALQTATCSEIKSFDLSPLAQKRAVDMCGRRAHAPAGSKKDMHQFLLPDVLVLRRQDGQVWASRADNLQPGDELVSACGERSVVHSCCCKSVVDLRFVRVRLQCDVGEQLLLFTSGQSLVVTRPIQFNAKLLQALELQIDDLVATSVGDAKVLEVQNDVKQGEMTGIELEDFGSSFCIAAGAIRVDVFNDLQSSFPAERLSLFRFNCVDKLMQAISKSELLSACQASLQSVGISNKLSKQMLVQPEFAKEALQRLGEVGLLPLQKSHILVSASHEGTMWEEFGRLCRWRNTKHIAPNVRCELANCRVASSLDMMVQDCAKPKPWPREESLVLNRIFLPMPLLPLVDVALN